MKILGGDFNEKLGREDIFKPAGGNESLHQDRNDNSVKIVNYATSMKLVAKSTMFLHRNPHNFTLTYPNWKTHKEIDHILIDRRWNWSILHVRFFRGAECCTNHCLVVAKVTEKLAVNK
jgi:endonuclease/exonuclease/phosphatase family metal-dependent hydrolase